MAKTKYRLGTLVKVQETEDAPAHFGSVEEIRVTTEGTQYKVWGLNDAVAETDITASYREVLPRALTTSRKSVKNVAKKTKRDSVANAAA